MTSVTEPDRGPNLARYQQQRVLDRHLRDGRALADALRVGPGDRVLDLGCSTGLLTESLGDRVVPGGEVLGLDPLPLRVQMAHQHCSHPLVRFQIGRADDLSRFPDGSFTAVLAVNQARRWLDPLSVMRSCLRLLAPGGRLGLVDAAAEPEHPVREVQRQVLAQPLYAGIPVPIEAQESLPSAEQWERDLAAAGFDAVDVRAQPDPVQLGSPEAAIEFVQAAAPGEFLDFLPTHLRALARADVVSRLSARVQSEGVLHHEGMRLMAIAVRRR